MAYIPISQDEIKEADAKTSGYIPLDQEENPQILVDRDPSTKQYGEWTPVNPITGKPDMSRSYSGVRQYDDVSTENAKVLQSFVTQRQELDTQQQAKEDLSKKFPDGVPLAYKSEQPDYGGAIIKQDYYGKSMPASEKEQALNRKFETGRYEYYFGHENVPAEEWIRAGMSFGWLGPVEKPQTAKENLLYAAGQIYIYTLGRMLIKGLGVVSGLTKVIASKSPAIAKALSTIETASAIHPWLVKYPISIAKSGLTGGLFGAIERSDNKREWAGNVLKTAGTFMAFQVIAYPVTQFFRTSLEIMGKQRINLTASDKKVLSSPEVKRVIVGKPVWVRSNAHPDTFLKITPTKLVVVGKESAVKEMAQYGVNPISLNDLDIEVFKTKPSIYNQLKSFIMGEGGVASKFSPGVGTFQRGAAQQAGQYSKEAQAIINRIDLSKASSAKEAADIVRKAIPTSLMTEDLANTINNWQKSGEMVADYGIKQAMEGTKIITPKLPKVIPVPGEAVKAVKKVVKPVIEPTKSKEGVIPQGLEQAIAKAKSTGIEVERFDSPNRKGEGVFFSPRGEGSTDFGTAKSEKVIFPQKTFETSDQETAVVELFGKEKADKIMDKYDELTMKPTGFEAFEYLDNLIAKEVKKRGYDSVHYLSNRGLVGLDQLSGENWHIIDKSIIEAKAVKPIKKEAQGEVIFHQGVGKIPTYDAYFGTQEFEKMFPKEFGDKTVKLTLTSDVNILDLNVSSKTTRQFMADVSRAEYPDMAKKENKQAIDDLLRGDEKAIEDWYELWADKRLILPKIREAGFGGAKFRMEYLLTKEAISNLKAESQPVDISKKAKPRTKTVKPKVKVVTPVEKEVKAKAKVVKPKAKAVKPKAKKAKEVKPEEYMGLKPVEKIKEFKGFRYTDNYKIDEAFIGEAEEAGIKEFSDETLDWVDAWKEGFNVPQEAIAKLSPPSLLSIKELMKYRPNKPVMLYRGRGVEDEVVRMGSKTGYESWTHNKEVAKRWGGKNRMFISKIIKPKDILVDFAMLPKNAQEEMFGINGNVEREVVVKAKADIKFKTIPEFKGYKDLTTKILNQLKGHTTVSKEFVSNLTRQLGLKKAEVDLINEILDEYKDGEKIPVKEFADKVHAQLLPLGTRGLSQEYFDYYKGITLPEEQQGNVASYREVIYESPIKTSAADVHFAEAGVSNYFAHVRVEDMAKRAGKPIKTGQAVGIRGEQIPLTKPTGIGVSGIRRIIELQSDLFQKGRLEREKEVSQGISDIMSDLSDRGKRGWSLKDIFKKYNLDESAVPSLRGAAKSFGPADYGERALREVSELADMAEKIPSKRAKELEPLEPYRNTWHERIIREEIKRAAEDNKKILRLPTGETAMEVEGLGTATLRFGLLDKNLKPLGDLTSENMKVGQRVDEWGDVFGKHWIITEVLEDGKFRAVPVKEVEGLRGFNAMETNKEIVEFIKENADLYIETFDISGKIDTSNPIYKFYENDVQKFLKRIRPDLKTITDKQGVAWFETKITSADKGAVIAYTEKILGKPIPVEVANKALRKYFSEDEAKLLTQTSLIRAQSGKLAYGKSEEGLITLVEDNGRVRDKTLYHEMYHQHLQLFYSEKQINELNREVAQQVNKKTGKVILLDEAEEVGADYFADFVARKETFSGKIRNFFRRLLARIRRLIGKRDRVMETVDNILEKKRPGVVRTGKKGPPKFKEHGGMTPEEKKAWDKEGLRLAKEEAESVEKELGPQWAGKGGENDYIGDIIDGRYKLQIPRTEDKLDAQRALGGLYSYVFSKKGTIPIDYVANDLGLGLDEALEEIKNAFAQNKLWKTQYGRKVIGRTKEYKAISDDLKAQITAFFRPARHRTSRIFSLLGNKDTTIPMLAHVLDGWVKSGVKTLVEPYGGAFTIGVHSLDGAIKNGLKEFNSNLFDKEKYTVIKAIQEGKLDEAKQLVSSSVHDINQAIVSQPGKSALVNTTINDFLSQYPDSYIGSKQWISYVNNLSVGKEVTVYPDVYEEFRSVFQGAYDQLAKVTPSDLKSSVLRSVINKTGRFAGKGQGLIGANGFMGIEGKLFDKYGMTSGLEDADRTFKLAKKHGTKINLYNENGPDFLKKFYDRNPKTTGYFVDPPYLHETEVYLKKASAEEKGALDQFTSGDRFAQSHQGLIKAQKNGARLVLTNDIDQEYLDILSDKIKNAGLYAYKESNTPTSLVVTPETRDLVNSFLEKSEKIMHGEREELVAIKQLKADKALSNNTMARVRHGLGIKELKNATPEKLDEMIDFLRGLKEGDRMLSNMQIEGLSKLIPYGEFTWRGKPRNKQLITQREIIIKFREKADIVPENGKIDSKHPVKSRLSILSHRTSRLVAKELWPTVDLKEGHPMITRTVDRSDARLRKSVKNDTERKKKVHEFIRSAEKSEPIKNSLIHRKIYAVMSGATNVKLTKEETALVAYLQNFFNKARKELALQKYRMHYITHIEAKLLEKIKRVGLIKALDSYIIQGTTDLPMDIWVALDNIIGSKKFFRFAMKRTGGIIPTMDIGRIVGEYSRIYENKLALDAILPEAQAVQQLLLQDRSAKWMREFLQNLKGRGLDSKFRSGEMGWMASTADRIVDFNYLRLLAGNYGSALKNIIGGETNSFVYIANNSENRFIAGMLGDLKMYLTGKERMIKHPKKAVTMMARSGMLHGSYVDMARSSLVYKGKKVLETIAYAGMEIGEYEIRGTYLLGQLTKAEWEEVLSGKALDKVITPKRFRKILNEIAITQGIYTKVDSPLFVQTFLGRMLVQFNRWRLTNAFLLRRILKGATKEQRAGIHGGPNTRKVIRMLFVTALMTYLGYELGKAGYKKARKIAMAGTELIRNIYEIMPPKIIYDVIVSNPTIEAVGSAVFDIEKMAHYIGIADEPYAIRFKRGLEDMYIAAFQLFKTPKETKSEAEKKAPLKVSF